MNLETLKLVNYRNYEQAELCFDDEINLFIGENAQGKTNLLEAIYVLAMANSHRTSHDKELIHWNEEYARIEGKVQNARGGLPLDLVISKKGKKVKVNHLEKRKLSDYIGALNVVMFAPEDLNLVKGSPSVRRRFIDMEMGQVYPVYMHELTRYYKVLQQRNALLKELKRENTMLDILTDQLIASAVKIVQRRRGFLELLEKRAAPIHLAISREREELTLTYKSSIEVSEDPDLSKMVDRMKRKFTEVREREIDRGVTLVGPHREDLGLFVNGKDVQTYGSQGQQRTAALSLKLAEIELIATEVGEYPLLLLDDVLSELDGFRQSHLLHAIRGKVQTFVTTTSVDAIEHETIKAATRYEVTDGVVKERK
ncbi:MAG TPA: DNA replication/repair protein RecF [Bacillales bacterium]